MSEIDSEDVPLSVIIPTYNRPDCLRRCLEHVGDQTELPEEVIVVDDGELTRSRIDRLRELLPEDTSFELTSSDGPPSTSTARNTGVEIADSPVVLILDDDAYLGAEYVERLKDLYRRFDRSDLAGISGFDMRSRTKFERLYNRIFYLGNDGWKINKAGINSWDTTIDEPTRSDWISGNNASYKRDVLLDHPFPHWSGGREALEDIALGWELKNAGYHCLVDPELPVEHSHADDTETSVEFGVKWGRNQVRLFRRYGSREYAPLFLWAVFGNVLRNFIAPFADGRWRERWAAGIGFGIGVLKQLSVQPN